MTILSTKKSRLFKTSSRLLRRSSFDSSATSKRWGPQKTLTMCRSEFRDSASKNKNLWLNLPIPSYTGEWQKDSCRKIGLITPWCESWLTGSVCLLLRKICSVAFRGKLTLYSSTLTPKEYSIKAFRGRPWWQVRAWRINLDGKMTTYLAISRASSTDMDATTTFCKS